MKRLSLGTRMAVVKVVTTVIYLALAWGLFWWTHNVMPFWLWLPWVFVQSCLGAWGLVHLQRWLYHWVIERWINEQPEWMHYLLHLRLAFGADTVSKDGEEQP
jgi:hypothetical protein